MGGSITERGNLSDVYFDVNTMFNNALAEADRIAEMVASTIRMDAPLMKYKWLGQVPNMTRWVGQRTVNKLRGESQIIENEDWANGIEIERDDLEDDNLGLVRPRIADLARKGLDAMESEVVSYYTSGFAATLGTTYDGQFLYDTDHTAAGNGIGTAQDNLIVGAFSSTTFETGFQRMLEFKDENGKPLKTRATKLLHGPSIWSTVREVLLNPTLSGGGNNPNFMLVEPVMSAYITDGAWFLIDDRQGAMPVILQIRRDPTLHMPVMDMDDFNMFMNKTAVAGADATFGVGYGLWQTTVGSTG